MTNPIKQRLHYFDMMKGVAIFLVVMGHVIAMCVREIDRAPLFKFIEHIHMPLFFFISGWFTFKIGASGRIACPALKNRAIRLLLPMLVVSSLWMWYFPHSGVQSPLNSTFSGLWGDTWKNGYWFTLVLFEIVLLYAAITPLLNLCRNAVASILTTLCVCAILLFCYNICPAAVAGYISLELVAAFFPIFMFGVLAAKYRDGYMNAIHNSWLQTAAMLIFAVCLYMGCWPWEFNLSPITKLCIDSAGYICLATFSLAVFERWSNTAYSPEASNMARRAASLWEYLGKQSLGIYLLHYFFLFPMGDLFRPALNAVNVSLVPMLLFTAFWAACIVAVVLGIIKLIEPSKILSLLLTGNKA
ncbi:MAG: acyltransferase [Muribaculaceae bacterium]|nr:acyltransferase [Muribaculaceae bacterium]